MDYQKYIKKTFVINLDRRPDRFEKFKEKFPLDMNLIERVSAIDGNNLDKLNLNLQRKTKLNEIACFLSHKKCLLKIIVDESLDDDDFFIIFEDDVCFSNKFINNFSFLIETMKTKEQISYFNKDYSWKTFVAFFGGRFNENFTPDNLTRNWVKINDGIKDVNLFVRRFKNLTGHHCFDRTTHFIMMNKHTAKIIYNDMKQQNLETLVPIDVYYQDIQKNIESIEIIECFPHLCYSPISNDSDIQFQK